MLWYNPNPQQGKFQALSFRSYPQLKWSDHKPVACFLRCPAKVEVKEKKQKVMAQIRAQMDQRKEDELVPKVCVHTGQFQLMQVAKTVEQSARVSVFSFN